jgi:tetratricopeptide (TPR) repeat protein
MNIKYTLLLVIVSSLLFVKCDNKEEAYNQLIYKADSLFTAQKYNNAKEHFLKVFDIKPKDKYATKKITTIDSILVQLNKEEKYQVIIKKANGLYLNESYEAAKQAYENALRIKPEDEFATERLNDVIFMLEQQKEVKTEDITGNNPYHIIVGSFVNENNVIKFKEKLESQGYQVEIIERPFGGFKAVSYTSCCDLNKAYNDLKTAKKLIHPDSWVLYQKY